MTDEKAPRGWHRSRRGTRKGGPCWQCGHELSRVYDSGDGYDERYRECAKADCGARWVTREVFERRIA